MSISESARESVGCINCAGVVDSSGTLACTLCGRPLPLRPPGTTPAQEPWCDWCGRAIKQQDGQWVAVKGQERGYDPVPCEANTDDGTHEPASGEAS